MLAQALTQSGVGRPFEYFNPMAIQAYCERSGAKTLELNSYIHHLRNYRADETGVFGIKCHFHQLCAILPFEAAQTTFVRQFNRHILIVRKNKVQQAISDYRAHRSGVWFADDLQHAQSARRSSKFYDGNAIAKSLAFLIADEQGWMHALTRANCTFIRVYYEDLVSDYISTLHYIISYIGADVTKVPDSPSTQILGDHRNHEWERRFRLEFPDCTP
jgi:LPS sulfotransferase NodH